MRLLSKLVLAATFSYIGISILSECCSAAIPITKTPLYKHLIKTSEKVEPKKQGEKSQEKTEALTDEAHKSSNERTDKSIHKSEEESGKRRIERQTFRNRNSDLSALQPDMTFSDAIDVFRNSTTPPLNIIVLWRDIEENSDVDRYTTIGMKPVLGVSLGKNLELMLMALSSNPKSLGYIVDNGTIIIGTRDSIHHRSDTRIYDVTDLLGQPANYFIPPTPMPYYGTPYGGGYGGNYYGGQGAFGSPYIMGGYGTNVGSVQTGTGFGYNPYMMSGSGYNRGRDLAGLIQSHTSGTRR